VFSVDMNDGYGLQLVDSAPLNAIIAVPGALQIEGRMNFTSNIARDVSVSSAFK